MPNSTMKIILFWNTYFHYKSFRFGTGKRPFLEANCPIYSCFITEDRSLFNFSDVVVFSFQNLTLNDLPLHRFSHQRFIFYQLESPENTVRHPFESEFVRFGFFNWTMTYRLDSDIIQRQNLGSFVPYQRKLPSEYPTHQKNSIRTTILESPAQVDVSRKTKLVAWFVSHCDTLIQREDYVLELSQYVPVDIYGKCGNLSCQNDDACNKMLKDDYKFYLAFESSLCPDYVSEKLTRALLFDTVPIVLGAVDYNLFAPPHSVINIQDFSSPKHLAQYLKLLDSSNQLYARYFDWKRDYDIRLWTKNGWCHLCKIVNSHQPHKNYEDIKKWWIEDAECLETW